MSNFAKDIAKFNGIYKLPVADRPTLDVGVKASDRLKAFKDILAEELEEINPIIGQLQVFEVEQQFPQSAADVYLKATQPGEASVDEFLLKRKVEILTMLADLLGDIQVYCASEMAKFGLPLDDVLAIIMQSNFSKLGADGNPIYDERGKVMKGPAYWKPEPKIAELLATKLV